MANSVTSATKWEDLDIALEDELVQAVKKAFGFEFLMPVQKVVIPLFAKSYDVAVEAATGSGKTLSFLVPFLNYCLKNFADAEKSDVLGLVLTPTRELAKQITEVGRKLLNELGKFSISLLTGGTNAEHDIERLTNDGCNFIVATPGKMREILEKHNRNINMKSVYFFIMDEADRLLDQEYQSDLAVVLENLPKQRRTGIFSATLTNKETKVFKKLGMRNPALIRVQEDQNKKGNAERISVPKSLKNFFVVNTKRLDKMAFLVNFLQEHIDHKVLVFFNTCAATTYYSKLFSLYPPLKKQKMFFIHGQMKQKKRNKIIIDYTKESQGFLFTTDVLARGIDFPDVNWIVQIDPPQDPSFYIHRIGRTARVGREGNAILTVLESEKSYLDFMKLKGINMIEYKNDKPIGDKNAESEVIRDQMREILKTDRDLVEKSKAAFVSFMRSYKEHDLGYIFQFKHLDMGDIANSFFLLRLPRIKEILGKRIETFEADKVDIEAIEFKDQNQEKQFAVKKVKNVAKLEERKQRAAECAELMEKKRLQKPKSRSQKKRTREETDKKDSDAFSNEERLYKKLKKGQLSVNQFNKLMKEQELDEDDFDYDADCLNVK